MPSANDSLGRRIKEARNSSALTQADLAWSLGVSVKQLSFWETGKALPRLSNLLALSDHLGVSVDWLLGREDGR